LFKSRTAGRDVAADGPARGRSRARAATTGEGRGSPRGTAPRLGGRVGAVKDGQRPKRPTKLSTARLESFFGRASGTNNRIRGNHRRRQQGGVSTRACRTPCGTSRREGWKRLPFQRAVVAPLQEPLENDNYDVAERRDQLHRRQHAGAHALREPEPHRRARRRRYSAGPWF